MKKSYKKLAVVLAIMIFTLSIASSVFAAGTIKNLKAVYNNIKIFKNGTQVSMPVEPFIIDGTTYVPLRAVSEILDKVVTWDQATYSVNINDKPGTSVSDLNQQLYSSQLQVYQLQEEVKKLQEQLGAKKEEEEDKNSLYKYSKSQLENYLNDEYKNYFKSSGVYFEFYLSGDEDDLEVQIEAVDKRGDYIDDILDVDSKVTEKKIETLLKGIYDDIVSTKKFEDAEIYGYIQDDYEDIDFEFSSKGKLTVYWP